MRNKDLTKVATTSLKSLWDAETVRNQIIITNARADYLSEQLDKTDSQMHRRSSEMMQSLLDEIGTDEPVREIFEGTKDALAGLTIKRQAN